MQRAADETIVRKRAQGSRAINFIYPTAPTSTDTGNQLHSLCAAAVNMTLCLRGIALGVARLGKVEITTGPAFIGHRCRFASAIAITESS